MRKRRNLGWSLLAPVCALLICGPARAQIEWRVSVKIILDYAGNLPCDGSATDAACQFNTDEEIYEKYEGVYGNDLLVGYGRGYSFHVMEIVHLYLDPLADELRPPPGLLVCDGGSRDRKGCGNDSDCTGGTCENAEQWCDAPIALATRNTLEQAALADFNGGAGPNRFEWRGNRMNVYILRTPESGYGSRYRPGSEHYTTIIGQQHAKVTTPYHEAGHFLGLCHTQGCGCGHCGDGSGECNTVPRSDTIDDTLWDLPCWDRDQIAMWNFDGHVYADLAFYQMAEVDLALENLMSYHADRLWLTSDQLDRMTDTSNGIRSNLTTGCTHFVDASANAGALTGISACGVPRACIGGGFNGFPCEHDTHCYVPLGVSGVCGYRDGSSGRPYTGVADAADAANAGDIVLIRGGAYDESLIIQENVTLRANLGSAVIGSPGR